MLAALLLPTFVWRGAVHESAPSRSSRSASRVRLSAAASIQADAASVLAADKLLIAPALATSNVAMLGAEAERAMDAGADAIHINVMDGHFTEKLTWGPMFVKALRAHGITAPLDVQLTCLDIVDTQIEEFAAAGANYITFHAEGSKNVDRSLALIKEKGLCCGLVLNPSTPTSVLENVMGKVDIILLMSNNPGFKNQKFNDVVYGKVCGVEGHTHRRTPSIHAKQHAPDALGPTWPRAACAPWMSLDVMCMCM
jgi:ribulose-phosphate 3-epimerase